MPVAPSPAKPEDNTQAQAPPKAPEPECVEIGTIGQGGKTFIVHAQHPHVLLETLGEHSGPGVLAELSPTHAKALASMILDAAKIARRRPR